MFTRILDVYEILIYAYEIPRVFGYTLPFLNQAFTETYFLSIIGKITAPCLEVRKLISSSI